MASTVRCDPKRHDWWFLGELRRSNGADSIVIKKADLAASATDLARAYRDADNSGDYTDAFLIDLAPDDYYSPKESVVDSIDFRLLDGGRLGVHAYLESLNYMDDDDDFRRVLIPLIEPTLQRLGATIESVNADPERSSAPFFHSVTFSTPTRGKTLADLYGIAKDISILYEAASTGRVTRETVVDLIAGGHAATLIGQPEGPWLDVKSAHYDLKTPHGKISLAQAVSRFCNAEDGGVVVVGMDTKRIPGGELIKSIRPVPLEKMTVRLYRQTVENYLFPFPIGLGIQAIEVTSGYGLVIVSVPPQEEESKPFLVHGAIIGNGVEGAFISIVRRSGEDSIPITAQQIHGTLAAGRALLRRGQLPPQQP